MIDKYDKKTKSLSLEGDGFFFWSLGLIEDEEEEKKEESSDTNNSNNKVSDSYENMVLKI